MASRLAVFPKALKGLALVLCLAVIPDSYAGVHFLECQEMLKTGWLNLARHRTMPHGPLKGRKLAYGTPSPPLTILSAAEALVVPEKVEDGAVAVSNFMSTQGPSLAILPKDAPKKVTLVKEILADGTPHLLLRLIYDPTHTVHYWTQNLEGLISKSLETNDIVIEYGNQAVEGDEHIPYSPIRAFGGRYALQSRSGTTAFKVRLTLREGRDISEIELNLTEDQRAAIVAGFVERTNQINVGEMYNSIVRNCVTEIKDLFTNVGILSPNENPVNQFFQDAVTWRASGLIRLLQKHEGLVVGREHPLRVRK